MSQTSSKEGLLTTFTPIIGRSLDDLPADIAAVKALAQAAVNVEMFTIPLYMCSMTSIQGTHEINSKGTSYYKGRLWPGMATTAGNSLTPNQTAYNTIFSVFIQEMLHLQLAANLSAVLGVTPKFFDGTLLENKNHGWACYGKDNTVIPHIIDLQDTTTFTSVKVCLDELKKEQIDLFLAVEQSHEVALQGLKPGAIDKYFPAVPFTDWTAEKTEKDLPLFGTIGWMYTSLLKYLGIVYSDGTTLWSKMFKAENIAGQRDLFNSPKDHQPEYPYMAAHVTEKNSGLALLQAIDMVWGICDQGEGGSIPLFEPILAHLRSILDLADNQVKPQFQPSKKALEADYPSYNADGTEASASADADARATGDANDHWERFDSLLQVVKEADFMTWSTWFAKGKTWTADDLKNSGYDESEAPANIPSPDQVAAALNELKTYPKQQLSEVVTGAIAGINSVLTESWGNTSVKFPYPSMAGSGDRMSFYWAVYGEAPDLSRGLPASTGDSLQHACQGLDYNNPGQSCAAMEVYHTCRGSNDCKAQGGCGFAQSVQGGGGCGAFRSTDPSMHAGCGLPELYSAPNDNKCKTFGGCAVPISASQLYPKSGTMELDDVMGGSTLDPQSIEFAVGDSVYDTAWKAYTTVMQANDKKPGDKPAPSKLRTALPPST